MNPLEPWGPGGEAVRTVESAWRWTPALPPAVLVSLLVLGILVPALAYRSRRIDLGAGLRIVLWLLRASAVAAVVVVLSGPGRELLLERSAPRTLAVLLDASASMGSRDGPEVGPSSRWERAVAALRPALEEIRGPAAPEAAEGKVEEGLRIAAFLFDADVRPVPLEDFSATIPPRGERTDIGRSLEAIQYLLSGAPAAAVLLVTDGAANAGVPEPGIIEAARWLFAAGIPVHAILAGNETPRDLSLSAAVDAPFAYAGDPIPIRVRLEGRGFEGRAVTVRVLEGDRLLASREASIPADRRAAADLDLEVRFESPGRKTCRIEAPVLEGELTAANNAAAEEIEIVREPLRVLYAEHWPRWQYRFLVNALRRDRRMEPVFVLFSEDSSVPVEDRETALFPASAADLDRFDAVVIGDVSPRDLPPEGWTWLRDHVVQDGAGAIFIAGPAHCPRDLLDLPAGVLLPFETSFAVGEEALRPFRPSPTPAGLEHPILRLGSGDDPGRIWRDLPPLEWYCGVKDLKPAALVLARGPAGAPGEAAFTALPGSGADPVPLFIYQRAGRGSVLFVGTDETWKWRYQVGDRYFYGFWAKAIQHVGMPHRTGGLRPVRFALPPGPVPPLTPVPLGVSLDPSAEGAPGEAAFTPRLGSGTEALTVVAAKAGVPPLAFRLDRRAGSPSSFIGKAEFPEGGSWRLAVEGLEGRGEAAVEVAASSGSAAETLDPAVRPELLHRIAAAAGGRSIPEASAADFIRGIDRSPLTTRWSERRPVRTGLMAMLLLAVLLGAEWVLRKRRYLP